MTVQETADDNCHLRIIAIIYLLFLNIMKETIIMSVNKNEIIKIKKLPVEQLKEILEREQNILKNTYKHTYNHCLWILLLIAWLQQTGAQIKR